MSEMTPVKLLEFIRFEKPKSETVNKEKSPPTPVINEIAEHESR